MTLQEAQFALDSQSRAVRLVALDDIWTQWLQSPVPSSERTTLAEVGREMEVLVRQLQEDVPRIRELLFRDPAGFEAAAQSLVERAPIGADLKPAVVDDFNELGWFVEAALALSRIEAGADEVVSELQEKVNEVSREADPDGDLPPWFRCATLVTGVALSAAGTIATGGAALPIALALSGALVTALGDVDRCRGRQRLAPREAGPFDRLRAGLEALRSLCEDKLLTLDECMRMKADLIRGFDPG